MSIYQTTWCHVLRRASSGYSPVCHSGGLISIPCKSLWNLCGGRSRTGTGILAFYCHQHCINASCSILFVILYSLSNRQLRLITHFRGVTLQKALHPLLYDSQISNSKYVFPRSFQCSVAHYLLSCLRSPQNNEFSKGSCAGDAVSHLQIYQRHAALRKISSPETDFDVRPDVKEKFFLFCPSTFMCEYHCRSLSTLRGEGNTSKIFIVAIVET